MQYITILQNIQLSLNLLLQHYSHEIKKQEMKYIIYSGVGIVLMFVSNIGLECTQSSPVLGQGELTATHAKDSNDMYTGRMICHECSCIRSNKK